MKRWSLSLQKVFPNGIPDHADWTDKKEITAVLNTIGIVNTNHMFLPRGGGLDLEGASASHEAGCIELNTAGATVVKPKALHFEFIGKSIEWAYFRLEVGGLAPSGVYETLDSAYEELTELTKGNYGSRSVIDEGHDGYDEDGNEKPLPEEARLVVRVLEGSFLVVAKASPYNMTNSTYDGRHDKMSAAEFRSYMEKQFSAG